LKHCGRKSHDRTRYERHRNVVINTKWQRLDYGGHSRADKSYGKHKIGRDEGNDKGADEAGRGAFVRLTVKKAVPSETTADNRGQRVADYDKGKGGNSYRLMEEADSSAGRDQDLGGAGKIASLLMRPNHG